MPAIETRELSLLRLLDEEEGASLPDLAHRARIPGASPWEFPVILRRLLNRKLVWPVGTIHPNALLPLSCYLTDEGRDLLQQARDIDLAASQLEEPSTTDGPTGWSLEDLPNLEETRLLGETYLHWISDPPGERPRSSHRELALAAARAFASQSAPEPFARSVRTALKELALQGDYEGVRDTAVFLMEDYPDWTPMILELAYLALHHPYERVVGKGLRPFLSDEDMDKAIRRVAQTLHRNESQFRLQLPDSSLVAEMGTRIAQLLEKSFSGKNAELFLSAVEIFHIHVRLVSSVVTSAGPFFEKPLARDYFQRAQMLERLSGLMDLYSPLTQLESEHRRTACRAIQNVLDAIAEWFLLPLARLKMDFATDGDRTRWLRQILSTTDLDLRRRIVPSILTLDRLMKLNLSSDPDAPSMLQMVVPPELVASRHHKLLQHVQTLIARDDSPDSLARIYRWDVLDHLSDLLSMSEVFPDRIIPVCEDLRKDEPILSLLDEALGNQWENMRSSLLTWIRDIQNAPGPSRTDRRILQRHLSDLEGQGRPSLVLVSLPLLGQLWSGKLGLDIHWKWHLWVLELDRYAATQGETHPTHAH